MYKINPRLSATKGRVIRKISPFQRMLNGIFIGGYIVFFPAIGIIALGKDIQNDAVTTEVIIWALFGVITGVLMFYSVLKINRLRRINGFPANESMDLVKTAAENLGWQKIYHNREFSGFTLHDWFAWDWGKELTVIYNDDEVLVNVVALGRGAPYSPFHWIATINAENKFITEIRRLQTNMLGQS